MVKSDFDSYFIVQEVGRSKLELLIAKLNYRLMLKFLLYKYACQIYNTDDFIKRKRKRAERYLVLKTRIDF